MKIDRAYIPGASKSLAKARKASQRNTAPFRTYEEWALAYDDETVDVTERAIPDPDGFVWL